MKRKWLVIGIILLFIGTYGIPATTQEIETSSSSTSRGDWLYVGGSGPGNYTTIQSAVDAANPGDSVFVYSGTYYERVNIHVTIDLVGEKRDTTVIDGGGIGNPVKVYADNVRIRGFTIQNSSEYVDVSAGIQLFSSCNTISGNIIMNNAGEADGIVLFSDNNTITKNIITNNGLVGIRSWESSNKNTISENIITNNNYSGIMLISNNCKNIIVSNTINNNGDVHIGGFSGIFIINGNNNTISRNIVIENYGGGINLGGNNNNISGNILMNNLGDGIDFSGDNNIISENTVTKNSGAGLILFFDDTHSNIINNTITNNGIGIGLYDGSNNLISGNTIMNNIYGIFFLNAFGVGPHLFYHNNLINNIQNAYDSTKNNTWYNASLHEGNYWSDYGGTDSNGDGVGDTPYSIPEGKNEDLYPLMRLGVQKVIIFGRITNVSAQGDYIIFESVKTRVMTFPRFSLNTYSSGEQLILLKDYRGFMGVRYILAVCKIINLNSIICFRTQMGDM